MEMEPIIANVHGPTPSPAMDSMSTHHFERADEVYSTALGITLPKMDYLSVSRSGKQKCVACIQQIQITAITTTLQDVIEHNNSNTHNAHSQCTEKTETQSYRYAYRYSPQYVLSSILTINLAFSIQLQRIKR